MARPEQFPVKKVIGFDDALVQRVEDWRRGRTPIPNFSEAVRALIVAGVDASLAPDVSAGVAEAAVRLRRSEAYVVDVALRQFLRDRDMLPKDDPKEV